MKLYWMRDSDGIATIAKLSCFSQINYRIGSDYMSLGIQNMINTPSFSIYLAFDGTNNPRRHYALSCIVDTISKPDDRYIKILSNSK